MTQALRIIERLDAIAAADWDALRPDDNPFLSHAFLAGLERDGCLRAEWGWQAQHLGLFEDARLVAVAPLYLKFNSHGEFVFDHAWAQALERAGGDYYPKLLCAVPYSPVVGPRLLAGVDAHADARRAALLAGLRAQLRHELGLLRAQQRLGLRHVGGSHLQVLVAQVNARDQPMQHRVIEQQPPLPLRPCTRLVGADPAFGRRGVFPGHGHRHRLHGCLGRERAGAEQAGHNHSAYQRFGALAPN